MEIPDPIKIAIAVAALFLVLPTSTAHLEDDPHQVDLIAGQNTDAGDILVWNNDSYLYVKYVTDSSCCLNETHLDINTSVDGIPQTPGNNNPIPGKFDYKSTHSCVSNYTYVIPLNWSYGQKLYIAAHAALNIQECDEQCEETAWGNGTEFSEGVKWAMYFNYTVQKPVCLGTCCNDSQCSEVYATEMNCSECVQMGNYWKPHKNSACFGSDQPYDMYLSYCPQCTNGTDDDNDSSADYPLDKECTCGLDPSEEEPLPPVPELPTMILISVGSMILIYASRRR